jgi:hypothetical protein
MNQRKFETRGRPRWTTAPPPRWCASDSGRALSTGFDRHRPRARLQLPAQNLHESGLAAAVSADQALAIPAAELHGDVGEKGLGAELHGDVGGDDHLEGFRKLKSWPAASLVGV